MSHFNEIVRRVATCKQTKKFGCIPTTLWPQIESMPFEDVCALSAEMKLPPRLRALQAKAGFGRVDVERADD